MKKLSAILAALLACTTLLTACGGDKQPATQPEEQTKPSVEDTAPEQTETKTETETKEEEPASGGVPVVKNITDIAELPAHERELTPEEQRRKNLPVPEKSDYVFDESNIVVTFGAFADTHLQLEDAKGSKTNSNYALALDFLNAYTNNGLDTLFFAGDMTDDGAGGQAEILANITAEKLGTDKPVLYAIGNHDMYSWPKIPFANQVLHEAAYTSDITHDVSANYCRHSVVNGVHFIQVSANNYTKGKQSYSNKAIEWLKVALAHAAKEAPDMPIFVSTHLPIENTVYGSNAVSAAYPTLVWFSNELTEILAGYPQVVLMTGHTHYPEQADTTLIQDEFTMVNVGTLNYMVIDNWFENQQDIPKGAYDHPSSMLVEVDGNGGVRITRFDYALGAQIGAQLVLPPSTHEDFLQVYTYGRGNAPGPQFPVKDAIIEVVGNSTSRRGLQLNFTAAESTTDATVYYYEVSISSDASTSAKTQKFVTDFYTVAQPEDMMKEWSINIGKVTIGATYTVTLTPYNFFDTPGETQVIEVDLSNVT